MAFIGKWFGFGKNLAFDEGIRAYEKKDFPLAAESFRQAVDSATDQATRERAKSYLAGALGKTAHQALAQDEPALAETTFLEAVQVRPSFADLWHGLAQSQARQNKTEEARASFQKALELNARYAAARFSLGLLDYKTDPKTAFTVIAQAVESDERLQTEDWAKARSLHEADDHPAAYEALQKLRPAPSQVHDLVDQGHAAAKQNDWLRAAFCFQQASQLAPRYADLPVLRGQALLELGQVEEAADCFQQAVALNPDYADAHALLGITFRRLQEEEKALASFRQALKSNPDHPIASQELLYRRI